MDDPTISRVRAARHRRSVEVGHDARRLVAFYLERERELEPAPLPGPGNVADRPASPTPTLGAIPPLP
jgi:hypothetical protein